MRPQEESLEVDETVGQLLVVTNLRTGHVLRSVRTGGAPKSKEWYCYGTGCKLGVQSLVLKENGSLAWIMSESVQSTAIDELHAVDKSGSRILAAGASFEDTLITGLALKGSRLTWEQNHSPAGFTTLE
jgi:hypothetical protein